MIKNRYFRTLLGRQAEILVGKNLAYTTQATYDLFTANAAVGEIGVFNADTRALISAAGPVGANVNIFIALKRANSIKRSGVFTTATLTPKKNGFVQAVKPVWEIQLTGVPTLKIQDITYQAVSGIGTAGNAITIVYVVAGANTVLSVGVVGNAITVNIATNGASAATSTAAQVLAAVNAFPAAAALVIPRITGTATTVQVAQAVQNLAGGVSSIPALAIGDNVEILVIETTPGREPMARYSYPYTVVAADTYVSTLAGIVANVAKFNADNRYYKNSDFIVNAAQLNIYNASLTALNFGQHFTVAIRGVAVNYMQAVNTVAYNPGNGMSAAGYNMVLELENQGHIIDGVTTNYPKNGAPAEYGLPESMVDYASGYDVFSFEGFKTATTPIQDQIQNYKRLIILALPSVANAANPHTTNEIATLFGLALNP